jgi:hypothetical protein
MQVYNLHVGEAARPGAQLTLEQLVEKFASAINSYSPVLGQLFIHRSRPPLGKAWRITQNSKVPKGLPFYDHAETEQLCHISVEKAGCATAFSEIVLLSDLHRELLR